MLAVFHWYMVNGFELVGRMSETKITCILELWMNLVFCFLNRFYWDFLNIKMHSPGGGTLSSPECVWKASKRAEERSDCVLVSALMQRRVGDCCLPGPVGQRRGEQRGYQSILSRL